MVGERIAIQAEQLLVRFAFEFVTLRLDVPSLHIDFTIVKLED